MAKDKNLYSKIMISFGFLMVTVFIVVGIVLMFSPTYNWIDPNMKYVVGFFFIAYGLFRLARVITQIREQKRKNFYDE